MRIFKALVFGTVGALAAWHMSHYPNSGPTSVMAGLIFFNVISIAASLIKKT